MVRILTGLMLVVLTGCEMSGNKEDLESFTQDAYKSHKPDIEPLPALTPVEVVTYQSSGKTDPFDRDNLRTQKLEEKEAVDGGIAPDLTRRKEPLESFPLDSLELVGIVRKDAIDWGVIQAPNGTVHRVSTGNHMGKNFGEVVSVGENVVALVELVRDSSGRWKKRDAGIHLIE